MVGPNGGYVMYVDKRACSRFDAGVWSRLLWKSMLHNRVLPIDDPTVVWWCVATHHGITLFPIYIVRLAME